MTKPKGRSKRDTPATGTRQSARVQGRTQAPPDPQAWETVTTVAERAKQIIKIMDWYVADIRDGRHMKQEWILLHTTYIIDFRDRITEHSIQQTLLDMMAKVQFPYIHRRAWNVIQFWVDPGGRNTYHSDKPQKHSNKTPTTPSQYKPPHTNPTSAATPADILPEMSAFEKLLQENATIIALTTKSPDTTRTHSPATTQPNQHPTDILEEGVEETKDDCNDLRPKGP